MPDSAPLPVHATTEVVRARVRSDGGPLPTLEPLAAVADLPSTPTGGVPSSPPPTYEEVLAENRLAAAAQLARAASLEAATASEGAGASGGGTPETGAVKASSPPRSNSATVMVGRGGALQIQHKSSKELYRAVAAQWGLTCKMSDKCRCFDCQGRYFDCEFEGNEHDKGDGGLGATTPMFISEVMAGSACTLL